MLEEHESLGFAVLAVTSVESKKGQFSILDGTLSKIYDWFSSTLWNRYNSVSK